MMKIASRLQGSGWGNRIFVLTLALSVAPAVPVSFAQELLPELAAPVAKYKSALEALNKEKQDALTRAAQSYVSALNSVETSAATSGKNDVVAAVAKEREALAAGTLEPDLPAGLPPMRLQGTRRALLGKLSQINADHSRRKKQLDGTYINALIALQEKAAANPELAKQIAAEKAALLEGGGTASNGGGKAKKANLKNVMVNGDFEKMIDGKPDRWQYFDGVTVLSENGNTFIRFNDKPINRDGTGPFRACSQDMATPVPANAERIAVSARVRTMNVAPPVKAKEGWLICPYLRLLFYNNEKECETRIPDAIWGGRNGSWKEIRAEGDIPLGTTRISVFVSSGNCPGQIDFDDVELTFK